MRPPRSLQQRLGLTIGLLLTLLWVAAASVTGLILRAEVDEVFDSALQETAQRLLPLAVVEIVGRDEEGVTQRLGEIRPHEEYFTYVVRNASGTVLLQSHDADPSAIPAYDGTGFRQTASLRLYNEDALHGSLTITVAEPLAHRATVAREIGLVLGLPLLVVIPVALLAVVLAVRASLAPLRRFRDRLAVRTVRDLSPVAADDLPAELGPVARTVNALLERLNAAFAAERSFAANAAHELRTPLAGAIAQAQRLQSETADPAARHRAAEIEATLKRLTRLSERLMQLARAEGGRLRSDKRTDLRAVARIVAEDIARAGAGQRLRLQLPETAVISDLDPDAFGILARNLIDNALRHGDPEAPVEVTLDSDGTFTVANDGPVVPPEALQRLTERFHRANAATDGSGLGLAIVAAIAERIDQPLRLESPRPGSTSGFAASLDLPVEPVPALRY